MKKVPYFVNAARDFGESIYTYVVEHGKYNYVIKHNGDPLLWNDGTPVIFGDLGEVANELANWPMPIENVSIITEKDYIENYLGKELKFYIEDGIMDSNTHDAELVRRINDAWVKNREGFYPILCALYRRDIDEITDADSFQIDMWRPDNADGCTDEIINAFNKGKETGDWKEYNKLALDDMIREWDLFATNYLEHIADDTDLECILNFLHYPYLPIYKD